METWLRLAKERFKFSVCHLTVFGPHQFERLHGHNYRVAIEMKLAGLDAKTDMSFDFNQIKPQIDRICAEWDERILLPGRSPYLKIKQASTSQYEVFVGEKFYSLPAEDVIVLPVANITCESLSQEVWSKLAAVLREEAIEVKLLRVEVTETQGQSAWAEG